MQNNESRRQSAYDVRVAAAQVARDRVHPEHVANGDEQKFRRDDSGSNIPSYLISYTKGLPHDHKTGLVQDPAHFNQFVRAIDSGDPRDFVDTPLGFAANTGSHHLNCDGLQKYWKSHKAKKNNVSIRAWESQGAGNTFDLEGPDAQATFMPPAPALGSAELTAEMGEVYAQALLRDVPFTAMSLGTNASATDKNRVKTMVDKLNQLDWFAGNVEPNEFEASRLRESLLPHTAFRGITPGDDVGPYISQFLLAGNRGINGRDEERNRADGLVTYGAINIDQRVRFACPGVDYMTTWPEWLDVQNGADFRGLESYEDKPARRFITTPRDLATYVHYDALYEAYLNACLFLLAEGVPFDPGIPFQAPDAKDHQQGFAHFGGPHILSLVTEVATRALKAVRYQKFNVHRRGRPELLGGRLEKASHLVSDAPELGEMFDALHSVGILDHVRKHNKKQNKGEKTAALRKGTLLLPMAFCEGSPMHPAYGAGHATVAGACVTILKAFFDHKRVLEVASPGKAFVPNASGTKLVEVPVLKPAPTPTNPNASAPGVLTVEGELNKLCSNISIGRDWAGVHYFTDYIESVRMGEEIAIGILEEQKLTYGENFSMTVPLFDGGSVRI
ncbi:MAG: vanadium-dependent haloperoxidase [Pseudomonadota bacterium]